METEKEGEKGISLGETDFVEEGRSLERRGDQADTDGAAGQGAYSCMSPDLQLPSEPAVGIFDANIPGRSVLILEFKAETWTRVALK